MNSGQTRCLVLKTADFGESDKLVTFFSEDLGRLTGLAKGAKLSKKRFVNKLEQFSTLTLTFRQPRASTLIFIQEAELVQAHLTLRQQYQRFVAAAYISELVIKFTRERDPDGDLYTLLSWALASLHTGEEVVKTAALFHTRLLTIVGYQPDLSRCSHCMTPVTPKGRYTLLPGNGALLCNRCRSAVAEAGAELPLQTLMFLNSAQQLGLNRLSRLMLPARAARQTLETLNRYSCHLLQRDIHGWRSFRNLFQSGG